MMCIHLLPVGFQPMVALLRSEPLPGAIGSITTGTTSWHRKVFIRFVISNWHISVVVVDTLSYILQALLRYEYPTTLQSASNILTVKFYYANEPLAAGHATIGCVIL